MEKERLVIQKDVRLKGRDTGCGNDLSQGKVLSSNNHTRRSNNRITKHQRLITHRALLAAQMLLDSGHSPQWRKFLRVLAKLLGASWVKLSFLTHQGPYGLGQIKNFSTNKRPRNNRGLISEDIIFQEQPLGQIVVIVKAAQHAFIAQTLKLFMPHLATVLSHVCRRQNLHEQIKLLQFFCGHPSVGLVLVEKQSVQPRPELISLSVLQKNRNLKSLTTKFRQVEFTAQLRQLIDRCLLKRKPLFQELLLGQGFLIEAHVFPAANLPWTEKLLLVVLIDRQKSDGVDWVNLCMKFSLTRGEEKLARALANGRGLRGLMEEEGCEMATARTHARNLYKKLQVHNQAAARALIMGWINGESINCPT